MKSLLKLYKVLNLSKENLIKDLCKENIKLRFLGSNLFFQLKDYLVKYEIKQITRKRFELNIWDTDFRVIISKKMINKIKNKINQLGGPFLLYNLTKVTQSIYYRFMGGKGSGVENYYSIVTFLGFDLKNAEKEIIGLTYFGCNKVYPFIKYFDPLMFRIVCHVIGDGNSFGRTSRWIQHKNNSKLFKDLLKYKLGFCPTVGIKASCEVVTISAYFARLLKYTLDIDIQSIKNSDTIKRFLQLPKDYQLQFLASFIVDEGHIRFYGSRSCIISQANKKFMEAVSDILINLGYEHSEVKEEIYRRKSSIYRINIYSQGLLKFHKDLKCSIKKGGLFCGLGHKQDQLENYIETLKRRIENTKPEIDSINKVINHLLKKKGFISYDNLRENQFIREKLKSRSKSYLINKFYDLVKKEKFIRISRGVYIYNEACSERY